MHIESNLGTNLRGQPEWIILRTISSARRVSHLSQGNYARDVELLFRDPRIDFALKGVTAELDPGKLSILRVKPYFADLDLQCPSVIRFG
jgi:hypothetical protein